MLIVDMIFFIQQLNTELKNCKMIYQIVKFVLEALSTILEFNYFCINGIYIHQIKGTAMGTKFVVIGSNLVATYEEVKMFELLLQLYSQDFVDFFIRNYVRF